MSSWPVVERCTRIEQFDKSDLNTITEAISMASAAGVATTGASITKCISAAMEDAALVFDDGRELGAWFVAVLATSSPNVKEVLQLGKEDTNLQDSSPMRLHMHGDSYDGCKLVFDMLDPEPDCPGWVRRAVI